MAVYEIVTRASKSCLALFKSQTKDPLNARARITTDAPNASRTLPCTTCKKDVKRRFRKHIISGENKIIVACWILNNVKMYLGPGVQCSSLGLILQLYHGSCWQFCLIDGMFRQKTCPASHMKNIYSSKSFDIVSDILQHYLDTMLFVHAYQECTSYLHQNNLEIMYETYYDRKQNRTNIFANVSTWK